MGKPLATTREWRALAKIDPLFVVATHPGKRGAWDPAEFYAHGASDWADAERQWRHYEPSLGGVCVEVGCGAGRHTHALAQSFERVVALDVSDDMIELARQACPSTVEFKQVDGVEVPLPDASVDAVFTAHVLQHLDKPEHVVAYLRDMYRVLRPGGTAMIHTVLRSRKRPLWRKLGNDARLTVTRRMLARGHAVIAYRGLYYTMEEMRGFLDAVGFIDVELREFRMRSNDDPHPFWLCRRSSH